MGRARHDRELFRLIRLPSQSSGLRLRPLKACESDGAEEARARRSVASCRTCGWTLKRSAASARRSAWVSAIGRGGRRRPTATSIWHNCSISVISSSRAAASCWSTPAPRESRSASDNLVSTSRTTLSHLPERCVTQPSLVGRRCRVSLRRRGHGRPRRMPWRSTARTGPAGPTRLRRSCDRALPNGSRNRSSGPTYPS